jgi:outer membrane protein assembly factor BamE
MILFFQTIPAASMSKPLFSVCLLASLNLVSCSTILNNLPGVYSLDIQQGNIVDQEMVNQLKPHMNKRQVLYVMGSPMLKDAFYPYRWDYIYVNKASGKEPVQKRITLVFKGDELAAMQGDLKPGDLPMLKVPRETTVVIPKRHLDKTLWEKITGLFGYTGSEDKHNVDPDNLKPDNDNSAY